MLLIERLSDHSSWHNNRGLLTTFTGVAMICIYRFNIYYLNAMCTVSFFLIKYYYYISLLLIRPSAMVQKQPITWLLYWILLIDFQELLRVPFYLCSNHCNENISSETVCAMCILSWNFCHCVPSSRPDSRAKERESGKIKGRDEVWYVFGDRFKIWE